MLNHIIQEMLELLWEKFIQMENLKKDEKEYYQLLYLMALKRTLGTESLLNIFPFKFSQNFIIIKPRNQKHLNTP